MSACVFVCLCVCARMCVCMCVCMCVWMKRAPPGSNMLFSPCGPTSIILLTLLVLGECAFFYYASSVTVYMHFENNCIYCIVTNQKVRKNLVNVCSLHSMELGLSSCMLLLHAALFVFHSLIFIDLL